MNRTFYCTHCGGSMSVADEHVGMAVTCPHCSRPMETGRLTPAAPFAGSPPPPPPPPPMTPAGFEAMGVSPRHKVVAGLLGVLLPFGVHRFYLGYMGLGFLQLILVPLTCGVASLWCFIEGLLCFAGQICDVEGRPLRD